MFQKTPWGLESYVIKIRSHQHIYFSYIDIIATAFLPWEQLAHLYFSAMVSSGSKPRLPVCKGKKTKAMEPSFLKAFPEFQVNPFSEEEDIAQGMLLRGESVTKCTKQIL